MENNFETKTRAGERIQKGIWRPGILDEFSKDVAAAAATKLLFESEAKTLRLLGDPQRFGRPMRERIRAGKVLAKLRNEISPGADLHNIVKSQLAHGAEIKKVDEEFVDDLVKGNLKNKQIFKTDGLITNLENYPLYVAASDCYPVGVYDPENKAIGAFHTGIYGFLKSIEKKGLEIMGREYGTDPQKIKVVIAPGISAEGYRISENMFDEYRKKFPEFDLEKYSSPTGKEGEICFDLGRAIKNSLISQGVPEENIQLSQYHTDIDNELFSSERVEGAEDRDSFGFMIALKNEQNL